MHAPDTTGICVEDNKICEELRVTAPHCFTAKHGRPNQEGRTQVPPRRCSDSGHHRPRGCTADCSRSEQPPGQLASHHAVQFLGCVKFPRRFQNAQRRNSSVTKQVGICM